MNNIKHLENSDLGSNIYELVKKTSLIKNGILIDLGVRTGVSSEIMLLNSKILNNKVYGVDVDFGQTNKNVLNDENYETINGDSCTIGKYWNKPINCLFIDTFHIKEQVMCELYYWYKHVVNGGFIIFHDSNWPVGKFDIYNNIKWDRVEDGIKLFFNVNNLNYEDDYIKIEHFPDSWGMTIVTLKNKKNYVNDFKYWSEVFKKRNELINLFWNETNKGNNIIDLILEPNEI